MQMHEHVSGPKFWKRINFLVRLYSLLFPSLIPAIVRSNVNELLLLKKKQCHAASSQRTAGCHENFCVPGERLRSDSTFRFWWNPEVSLEPESSSRTGKFGGNEKVLWELWGAARRAPPTQASRPAPRSGARSAGCLSGAFCPLVGERGVVRRVGLRVGGPRRIPLGASRLWGSSVGQRWGARRRRSLSPRVRVSSSVGR